MLRIRFVFFGYRTDTKRQIEERKREWETNMKYYIYICNRDRIARCPISWKKRETIEIDIPIFHQLSHRLSLHQLTTAWQKVTTNAPRAIRHCSRYDLEWTLNLMESFGELFVYNVNWARSQWFIIDSNKKKMKLYSSCTKIYKPFGTSIHTFTEAQIYAVGDIFELNVNRFAIGQIRETNTISIARAKVIGVAANITTTIAVYHWLRVRHLHRGRHLYADYTQFSWFRLFISWSMFSVCKKTNCII